MKFLFIVDNKILASTLDDNSRAEAERQGQQLADKTNRAVEIYELQRILTSKALPKCSICNENLPMLASKICWPCADLEIMIDERPEIAKQILAALNRKVSDD